jgi:predicted acetyltransferase
MTVTIRDARMARSDRAWIEAAYHDYLDDLAAGATGVFPALDVTGQSERDLLAHWFRGESAVPLVILRSGSPVGFALVERTVTAGPYRYRMTEFFIRRDERRLGLGREAASLIFTRFQGDWLVSESTRNQGAVAFWRKVIGAWTHGRFRERLADGEVRHSFTSPASSVGPR